MTSNKQVAKIPQKGHRNIYVEKSLTNKKTYQLVPKVVIDLPFEGRKVKGSQKNKRWGRVSTDGK